MPVTLHLPEGITPGRVIGSGGCFMKQIRASTGVSCSVDGVQRTIELKGRAGAGGLEMATEMLTELFREHLESRDFGDRCQLLAPSAFPEHTAVKFVPRHDEVSQYLESTAFTSVLVPAAAGDAEDLLAEALASTSLASHADEGWHSHTVYSASAAPSAVERLVSAASTASGHAAGFDELKLRFNFGKMFFCGVKDVPAETPFHQHALQGMKRSRRYTNSYSNCVPAATAQRVKDVLTGRGFVQVEPTKHSLTVHVDDQHSLCSRQYAVSFDRGEDQTPSNELAVRKMKTRALKVFTLTCVGHGTRDLDSRLKLIAQHHFDQETPLGLRLQTLARQCQVAPSGDGWRLTPEVWGHLPRLSLGLRACRFKTKTVFQGRMLAGQSSILLRISILRVQSVIYDAGALRDVTATEITGSCVQLSEALEVLRDNGEANRVTHTERVAGLVGQLRAAVEELVCDVAADGAAGAEVPGQQ